MALFNSVVARLGANTNKTGKHFVRFTRDDSRDTAVFAKEPDGNQAVRSPATEKVLAKIELRVPDAIRQVIKAN